ncbi:hypothetical protein [Nocardiopsis algeriensis]|uniref:DUF4064 domain-containing protein n=1 Tax=Nocardiopsis algeriensis TaxID=1478215 RepID=A0A841ILA9_9ACTN|nr:hypothetical protein [Nocardiopsis algeriensis]
MFPPGQDPYDSDGHRDGVPPHPGPAHRTGPALSPDAPLPRKVATVRNLMFVGGASGLALAVLFVLGLSTPPEEMALVLREQAAIAEEQGVEFPFTIEAMRSAMTVMAAVTGAYGLLSTVLATRIRTRTVGVFWGVVLFQTAAGALLLWMLLAGDLLLAVPLGFAVFMVTAMLSREGRAHYGLL